MKTDVLVIGSGIAGLSFAIKVATAKPEATIHVLTKSNNDVGNTIKAQGGIAVVVDKIRDSFEQHIEDTMKAGKGINDPEIVKMVISQAPERLYELINWGTSFDANELGELELGLEGGHSQKRIVHHQDLTGKEMETKLLQKAASYSNIIFYDHYFVTDIILKKQESSTTCIGVRAIERKMAEEVSISSRITFLATGGSGRIFENTTNPLVATGDGIAMAHRAGAKISNMNFIQFHPTALYTKNQHSLFLISEAVRGFGAHLVDSTGNRFLFKYDTHGELATRDIVSEAIMRELQRSGKKSVFLDCRHLNPEAFKNHFPTIVQHCLDEGINYENDLIPIVPAAHYQCGGIQVDKFARTSINQLYASGECAHTGLHGANRLASNSLLEALVFSHQAAGKVVEKLDSILVEKLQQEAALQIDQSKEENDILNKFEKELNHLMSYNLLYTSEENEKKKALVKLNFLDEKLEKLCKNKYLEFFELKNMIQTAIIILEHAIKSKFFNKKKTYKFSN
ncbi:L-aspartate oxidase [Salegentibacter salinarum]|nr:L-aspartate oxidase [Salegentibacter salinarum]SKB90903.1 L-aspartate oxidase [Salegentibacter salinarum]